MIRNARVLRAGFIPKEIEHRDPEVNHLSSVLEPITAGEPADTAVVTGPSGAGKTCISKFVTERLLDSDRLRPIRAGIQCMDSIGTIQAYLAHENANRNRTQVQAALRMRARELRDEGDDDDAATTPVL